MTRHWLAVSFLALATSVSAEPVLFQSGEHVGFTRLVATLPSADTQWRVTGSGRDYTFKVEGDDFTFNLDDIFTRIPRTRLSNLVASPKSGEVHLQLGCDCEVSSAWYNDRHVIMDIRDATDARAVAPIPANFLLQMESTDKKEPYRYTWAEATPVPTPPLPTPVETPEAQVPDPTQNFEAYVSDQDKVSRVAQQVINQINRATEQNLLEAQTQNPQTPEDMTSPDGTPQRALTDGQANASQMMRNPLNVTTYNAMDVAAQEIATVLAGRAGASECIADGRLDIESWAGETDFATDLGKLRSGMVGEFDLTSSESMTTLARFYIAHTFGVEAEQILRGIPDNDRDPVLTAMAQLVETGHVTKFNPFFDQGHCASSVAFWAAMSGQQLSGKTAVDSALETLAGLPVNLREHLAPVLSNRFVELGHVEAASLVLNSIERTNTDPGPEFDMAQAALHAELGETDAAVQKLEKVAAQNTTLAPAAVVELIASHVAQDTVVPSETVSLVSALAVEHKAGMMGPALRNAHAQARMLAQDFTPAFDVVAEIAKIDGMDAALKTRSEVASALIDKAEGFDILTYAISQKLTNPDMLAPEIAVTLAERLYALGFHDQTKRVLQALPIEHATPGVHLLKAKVALADKLPRRAEAELMSITGSEADALRARARSMAGDHQAAAEILHEMGEVERAAFEAWLGGDLSGLSALDLEVYQRIEAMLQAAATDTADSDAQTGALTRNRALVSDSKDARDTLSELLELHRVTEPSS
ncbi:hypothetical protein [Shimia sp. Alg240-R146]|uniref:hypothetical protein n=1 Tax=Shimia sp. Alg240-R146 TaxID=2993449 RepID=UPI0022E5876B|nr:hypothetical protein [Shimia sp. Alg240-R146]